MLFNSEKKRKELGIEILKVCLEQKQQCSMTK